MDEKFLEKLDELIQELSCMNGNLESISENLEALAGCVDDDEGKPRLLIDGRVTKYDPVAAQNARAVQRRMASVVEKKEDDAGHNQGKTFVVEPRELVHGKAKTFVIERQEQENVPSQKILVRGDGD